ncbi:hypothetical protein BBP40_011711 [Aspergillus hancockii]|nr:hypothetical protein BBP40_011711 [Aspergillus hancockii]
MVVKHKDVRDVLTDPRLSKASSFVQMYRETVRESKSSYQVRQRDGFPEISSGGKEAAKNRPTFVDMDPPDHTRQRDMVSRFFTDDYVEHCLPFIQDTVQCYLDRSIEAHKNSKVIDLVKHFALPIPSHVTYHILGIPEEDFEYLSSCSASRSNGSNTAGAAQHANQELLEYLEKLTDN